VSISSILTIAKSALSANQTAIQTLSHNIANVNTPGYSRQEAVLEEAMPTPSSIGLMGNGVTVRQIKSYLD
jgi:flagellar hook-associated protein 1 FlgK